MLYTVSLVAFGVLGVVSLVAFGVVSLVAFGVLGVVSLVTWEHQSCDTVNCLSLIICLSGHGGKWDMVLVAGLEFWVLMTFYHLSTLYCGSVLTCSFCF